MSTRGHQGHSRSLRSQGTHPARARHCGLIILTKLEDASMKFSFVYLLCDETLHVPIGALEGEIRLCSTLHQDDSAPDGNEQEAESYFKNEQPSV